MKHLLPLLSVFVILATVLQAHAGVEIPANDPNIQYYGRWDFTNPFAPAHSWPGVYIVAEFTGTSIGVIMTDNYCYYNVIIDGGAPQIFHPASAALNRYPLAAGLAPGRHTIRLEKRNETTWTRFTFHGFLLDDGATLLPPAPQPERRIEFIGDSFTSASGNEYDKEDKPAEDAPLTNISAGFGPLTASHFGAQYTMTSRSGFGMVMDWQGSLNGNLPDIFDQTHIYTPNPPWDFEQWIPNLVVIGLGLNDYSGFGGWNGPVSESNRALYKERYHRFISTLRDVYPGVKILAVAPHVEWLQTVIAEVVAEENNAGMADVFYTFYPFYTGGYVYQGHPNVATHRKIADLLIAAIERIDAWTPYVDALPPQFTRLPDSPAVSYEPQITLTLETDSYATVRFSRQDQSFEQMENLCTTTGQRRHSVILTGEHGATYTWYFRAADLHNNAMTQSAAVTVSFDTSKVRRSWKEAGFDDSGWKSGPAPLGYGSTSGLKTTCAPVITAYFRKTFEIADPSVITALGFLVKGRDGAALYLNGQLLERLNLPQEEEPAYATRPVAPLANNMNKMVVINAASGLNHLRPGRNVLAVEMHASDDSRGIAFDGQLIDNKNAILIKLGSEWRYDDGGSRPNDQIQDKLAGVAEHGGAGLPQLPILQQNYPNPFNPETTISIQLPQPEQVSLKVYNMTGAEVASLTEGPLAAGLHRFLWRPDAVASGLYFYQLQAGPHRQTGKAMLLR